MQISRYELERLLQSHSQQLYSWFIQADPRSASHCSLMAKNSCYYGICVLQQVYWHTSKALTFMEAHRITPSNPTKTHLMLLWEILENLFVWQYNALWWMTPRRHQAFLYESKVKLIYLTVTCLVNGRYLLLPTKTVVTIVYASNNCFVILVQCPFKTCLFRMGRLFGLWYCFLQLSFKTQISWKLVRHNHQCREKFNPKPLFTRRYSSTSQVLFHRLI